MRRLSRLPALAAASVALIALRLPPPASALDFGLTLSDDSSYTYQGTGSLQQKNRVLAWLSYPLGEEDAAYASGFYEFKGTYEKGSSDVDPWRLDVDRFELFGSRPGAFGPSSALRYSAGRFAMADYSRDVLSGLSDGVRVEADVGNATAYASAGYRGLLYKGDAYSSMNDADLERNSDDDEYFAPRRGFVGAGARAAELLEAHDIGVETLSQFDLSGSSGKVHTQYLEPYIRGRLGHAASWDSWGVFELIEADDVSSALAFGESFTLNFPELSGLAAKQSAVWASGGGGSLAAFNPVTHQPVDATSYFTFTDLLKLKLEASVVPARSLAVSLGAAAYFRSGRYDPDGAMALRSDPSHYRGFEISADTSAKLASDLSMNLSGGVLIPNAASAYESGTDSRYSAELYAAVDL